jgi:DNA-binding transcriptional MerR regulator
MSLETEKWLTLSEVIGRANLRTSEARRLVTKFGRFLAARNFGDIIKYPPTAAEALSLISHLSRQGWNTEAIEEILTPTDRQKVPCLHDRLLQEVVTLMAAHNQACQSMQSTLEMVEGLVANMAMVAARLAAAEEEIQNLKKENQTLRTRLAHLQS